MGRAMRWLKKLFTGKKEERRCLKENDVADECNGGVDKQKRWSFVKQRRSEVDGGRRPLEEAIAAAAEPCHCGKEEDARARQEKAAVMIQKSYRGYLARKALRALRSLVKLQALVRGYLVRKQTATTLHRLQALMRLQASSRAVKNASYRKSMEQERIAMEQETSLRTTPWTPRHRRRLSDSTDSNYERSPRIVEMDTCHLRSASSRMSGRHARDHSSDRLLTGLGMPPSCSPLYSKQPLRLSTGEREPPRHAKTAQNTPRFGAPPYNSSPAKSVDGLARRFSPRDALASPRYMAGTASSAARTRCQSAPRQRHAEAPPRASLNRAGSRKSCSQTQDGGFCFHCSETARTGCSEELSDEAARDYYLDRMW